MNPAEFANIARSEQHFWWYRGMNAILFRLLDPIARSRRFDRVLEAGCGTGYLASLLEKRYRWSMFAVDLGWQGLDFARSLPLERLTQADIAQLPFRDASFDAVLSMDVIVHFPPGEEGRAMAELARVTATGGLVAVRVSALNILRSRHTQHAHERQRFNRRRLTRLAESCGIRVERCTYANSLLLPAAIAKFRIWEPLTRQPPASGVKPVNPALDALLGVPLKAESALIGAGLNFPVGQSLVLIGYKQP
jgi:SAM-dependent methyltransferase